MNGKINNISKIIYIKDLLILQSPIIFEKIEKYVREAERKGVYIGDLAMNPYIYKSRSLDVPFLIDYIRSLHNTIEIFRDIYDEYLYELRLLNCINENYQDQFQFIFSAINNTFNSSLSDQYLFEDFGMYHSEVSDSTIMSLYETFNDYFIFYMSNAVSNQFNLKLFVQRKSLKYLPHIYDKIFEQFEYIYLPFY